MRINRRLAIAAMILAVAVVAGCSKSEPPAEQAAPAAAAPAPVTPAAEQPPAQTPAAKPAASPSPAARPSSRPPAASKSVAQSTPPASTPVASSTPPPPPKPVSITLPEGTTLQIRTTTAISTKTAQPGEEFTASLVEALTVGGETVVPKGATVKGKVVDADAGGRVKGKASLSVNLTTLEVGGRMVAIETNTFAREAASSTKKDAIKVGIGSGIGAAIGAIAGGGKGAGIGAAAGAGAGTGAVLATRGAAAVIESESVLSFRLTAPAKIR